MDPADRLAREAVEFGDLGAGQAVAVADHLVDHVGFGRVERVALPSHVLRGGEGAVGEGLEELVGRDRPGDRSIPKP